MRDLPVLLTYARTIVRTQQMKRKFVNVEIDGNFVLTTQATTDEKQVTLSADLGRAGAKQLHAALGEYLGVQTRSASRGFATSLAGVDRTQHSATPARRPVVLSTRRGSVVRLGGVK